MGKMFGGGEDAPKLSPEMVKAYDPNNKSAANKRRERQGAGASLLGQSNTSQGTLGQATLLGS